MRVSRRHTHHDALGLRQRELPDSSDSRDHRPLARHQLGLHLHYLLLFQRAVSDQAQGDLRLQGQGHLRTR